jgi:hypothetical protein
MIVGERVRVVAGWWANRGMEPVVTVCRCGGDPMFPYAITDSIGREFAMAAHELAPLL